MSDENEKSTAGAVASDAGAAPSAPTFPERRTPAAPPPPPPPAPAPTPTQVRSPRAIVPTPIEPRFSCGRVEGCDRIVIYGTGGIGKTTLASHLPRPGFLDVEDSAKKLDVARDASISSWIELRGKIAWVAANPPDGMRTLVVDGGDALQQLAVEHVVETRRSDKGDRVSSIEGFGFGKGWQYVHDEFVALIADLDRVARAGLNVCLVLHDVTSPVPTPSAEEFLRWEPNLYRGDKNGRGNVRSLVKGWAEHVVFLGYDFSVKDGRGQGVGTRTAYTLELPICLAKSRTLPTSMPFTLEDPGAVWRALGIK